MPDQKGTRFVYTPEAYEKEWSQILKLSRKEHRRNGGYEPAHGNEDSRLFPFFLSTAGRMHICSAGRQNYWQSRRKSTSPLMTVLIYSGTGTLKDKRAVVRPSSACGRDKLENILLFRICASLNGRAAKGTVPTETTQHLEPSTACHRDIKLSGNIESLV